MGILIKYFSSCVFLNIFMTSISLIINAKHIMTNYMSNLINGIIVINIIKIINQLSIVKNMKRSINYIKYLSFDYIMDFTKLLVYIFIIYDYNDICINTFMTLFFTIYCVNFVIIIVQIVINLFKPNLLLIRRNNSNNNSNNNIVSNFANDNIYINIVYHQNIIDYIATNSDITCAICLDEQKVNEQWSKLSCFHEFHNKCITNWFKNNNTCPTCRNLII